MSARLRAAGGNASPAVEVHRLRKTHPGGVEAVRGIDFQVAPGEVFGLLGPNGAGKSTTIGMLTTTIKPTSGSARLAGFDVVSDPIAARSVSSVVFQEPVLDKALTGRRNWTSTHGCGESRRQPQPVRSPSSPAPSGCPR
jgi:ABC-2 type transport system ATP-binding protein